MKGLHDFERDMLSESFAITTRGKICDQHTLNVSAYDPEGFEVLNEYAEFCPIAQQEA